MIDELLLGNSDQNLKDLVDKRNWELEELVV